MKIRKDDKVIVLSGKDKGKSGKVLKVFPVEQKLVVESINNRKKHIRPKKEGQKGQVIEQPAPVHVSNLQLICGSCEKPTRVGYKGQEKGKKVRICKKCGAEL